MQNRSNLPSDLIELAAAAETSLEAGDFAEASERLGECLAAFQAKERVLVEVEGFREWLRGCLTLAHVLKEHLSRQRIQEPRFNYGRVESVSLWSVRA
jgi:hypothetical protein